MVNLKSYPNLVKFVEAENVCRSLFNQKVFDVRRLSAADIDELTKEAEAHLSPENLTCDGELAASAVAGKAKHLKAVINELELYYEAVA